MSNGLSGVVLRKLAAGKAKSNQEIIIEYLVAEDGAVILTDLQKKLYNRWKMADDLMRHKRYKTVEVLRIMRKRWEYSPAAAQRDLEDARYVFGSSRKNSKHYHLSTHVDYIDDYIMELRAQGEHELAIRLVGEKIKALKEMQDDKRDPAPPSAIIFSITTKDIGQMISPDFTEAMAQEIADRKLRETGITLDLNQDEYTVGDES